jgi:hypothetical protein
VRPVEGVDRHHVAVDQLVELGGEEARDVGRRRRERVVVVVPDVVDQRDRLVALAAEVQAFEGGVDVRAVPVRRCREGRRLLRVHVGVELVDEVVDLLVGDGGRVRDLRAAVTGGERGVVRDPHLDLVADTAERVVLEVQPA